MAELECTWCGWIGDETNLIVQCCPECGSQAPQSDDDDDVWQHPALIEKEGQQ